MTVATVLSDITPVLADGELIMKLHYHREDGAYDGWDAWLWPDGGEGGGYAFADEGGEMVSGTVHIYVESGVEGYTKEYGEDAVVSDSLIADGSRIEGTVENSIIFRGCNIAKGAVVKDSIIMQAGYIGENSRLSNIVMDKGVSVLNGRNLSGHESYPVILRKGSTV